MRRRLFRLTVLLVLASILCVSCAAVSEITGIGAKSTAPIPEPGVGRKIPLPPMVEDFPSSQDEAD